MGTLAGCAGSLEPTGTHEDELSATDSVPAAAWITLVTGDRVMVAGAEGTPVGTVVAARGREGISFSMTTHRGSLYVTPADAAALVAAGRLDAELFNVTALVTFGYDDAHRGGVPVIVTYGHSNQLGASAARRPVAGAQVTRELPSIDGVAMEVGKDKAADVWQSLALRPGAATLAAAAPAGEIRTIWLDRVLHPTLDHSVPQIGAPAAWAAGYTGKDVVVAVLDSGIDDTHADFAGKIVDARNFTNEDGTVDRTGHGTHVASTIAGTGAALNGRYRGVAPDAKLVIGKVCTAGGCPLSAILAGIEWAAIDKAAPIVNLSLGGPDTPGIDPLEEAINRLSAERGTLFVIAAGNEGARRTIDSPGSAEAALTVGAVDGDDALAEFSSRGPRVGDGGIKPDITAPGVAIVAALAAGTALGEIVDGVYVRLSGTSMATPHVAGAAALVLQQHPDWRGDQLKAALMGSARPNLELTPFEQGTGRVDVAAAITRPVVAIPASLNLGLTRWPHGDDAPIARTVTYTNASSSPTTLQLTLEARGPGGEPAPAGILVVSPATVTVPANGAAEVVVTADTRVDAVDGAYSGTLVATSAAGIASTIPLTIEREAESYDVSLVHLDQDGAPAGNFETFVARLDGTEEAELLDLFSPDGKVQVRLGRGRYVVFSVIVTTHGAAVHESFLVQPSLSVSADATVTLDSRAAKPVRITVPRPKAKRLFAEVGFQITNPTLSLGSSRVFASPTDGAIGQIGPDGPVGELLSHVTAQLADPGPAGDFVNSPAFFALVWNRSGGFFTGLDKHLRDSDLTVVHADYRASGSGQLASKISFPIVSGFTFSDTQQFSFPFQRTEYYNASPDGWFQKVEIPGRLSLATLARYRVGRHDHEVWNGAVGGPAFPDVPSVVRTGDVLSGTIAVLSDGAGHLGDANATGVTRLFQGPDKVGELRSPGRVRFNLAPGGATYRLETEATRTSPEIALSTRVTAAWTFRSSHVAATAPVPLLDLRFAPGLDDQNRARAATPFVLPISVVRTSDASPSDIASLTLEVSFDDGVTWQRAPVLRVGHTGVALLFHPAQAAFVSLRAIATDRAGGRVEETVIHAYALRR
jgi:subtilisin family serine protease